MDRACIKYTRDVAYINSGDAIALPKVITYDICVSSPEIRVFIVLKRSNVIDSLFTKPLFQRFCGKCEFEEGRTELS